MADQALLFRDSGGYNPTPNPNPSHNPSHDPTHDPTHNPNPNPNPNPTASQDLHACIDPNQIMIEAYYVKPLTGATALWSSFRKGIGA